MKIKITEFAERHFDKDFGATKILSHTKEDIEKMLNFGTIEYLIKNQGEPYNVMDDYKIHDGYAPFCKLIAMKNFTDARVGSLPITLENYQYLRSGYSARREGELPVFSRWLELPLGKPKAEWLVFVLYSKEQIDAESRTDAIKELKEIHYKKYKEEYDKCVETSNYDYVGDFENWLEKNDIKIEFEEFDADWGVVAILGQSHSGEEPMKPETMLRNALGKEEGGSGVPLDREKYLKSIDFWNKNATLK